VQVEEVACKLQTLLYEMDFADMRCYSGYHRSQKHLNWCWLLLIIRELMKQDGENPELTPFVKYLEDRAGFITSQELMLDEWYTPAHMEELGLVVSALSATVVGGGSVDTLVALKVFTAVTAGCIREHTTNRSAF